jgi:hypothetical protein
MQAIKKKMTIHLVTPCGFKPHKAATLVGLPGYEMLFLRIMERQAGFFPPAVPAFILTLIYCFR